MTSDECKEMSRCSSLVIRHSSFVIRHSSFVTEPFALRANLTSRTAQQATRPRRICSMQKFAIGVVFLCLLPLSAMAQDTSKAEIFGGYSYLRANVLPQVGTD